MTLAAWIAVALLVLACAAFGLALCYAASQADAAADRRREP